MKTRHLLIPFALGLGLALALLWLLGGQSAPAVAAPVLSTVEGAALSTVTGAQRPNQGLQASDVITVCPLVAGTCPYTNVRAAVDAALPGDVIKVAAATYTGVSARPAPAGYVSPPASGLVTQVVYISKTVIIRGGYTTAFSDPPDPEINPTTLDAQGQGRVLVIAGDISPTIEGLRITNGDAAGLGGTRWNDAGGGMYVISATATVSNNQVFGNTAATGGGLYLRYSPATLNDNTVISNTANNDGGGLCLYASAATLNGNTVISNTANDGGGLYLRYSPATLSGNTIISNTANDGGGLYLSHSPATLTNTVVADNQAGTDAWGYGSGLYIDGSSPRLLHTTIARNSGGDGSGVYVTEINGSPSTVVLTNTILVSHTVGIAVTYGKTAILEATLWAGGTPWANVHNWGGTGTIISSSNVMTGEPAFVDPDGGDYHIGLGSAAIDAGVDAGVETDIDGDRRPIGPFPDLGADEAQLHVYLPLVLRQYQ